MITEVKSNQSPYSHLELKLLKSEGGPVHEVGRMGPMEEVCRLLVPAGDTEECERVAAALAKRFTYQEYRELASRVNDRTT